MEEKSLNIDSVRNKSPLALSFEDPQKKKENTRNVVMLKFVKCCVHNFFAIFSAHTQFFFSVEKKLLMENNSISALILANKQYSRSHPFHVEV